MSLLSANLLIGTGIVHNLFGLAVPELRQPFFRGLNDGFSDTLDINERYAREAGFWFEMFGFLLIGQGFYMRSYAKLSGGRSSPKWFGWALTIFGVVGAYVMPASGFWLVIPQGLYLMWLSDAKNKKI